MKRCFAVSLFLGMICSIIPTLAATPSANDILANVAAFAASIKTFQGTVVQEQKMDGNPVKREIKFWRSGQDRFHMEMGNFWVIRNGATLWMKMGKTVTRSEAKEGSGNPIFTYTGPVANSGK